MDSLAYIVGKTVYLVDPLMLLDERQIGTVTQVSTASGRCDPTSPSNSCTLPMLTPVAQIPVDRTK